MFANLSAGIYSLYIAVGLLVGIATLIGYIKRPWTEKAKARRQRRKVFKLFMNGDPGIKGLIEAIVPAPERVADAESDIKEHTEILKKQGEAIKAQGETQKKQGVILEKVSKGLTDLTEIVVNLDKKMTGNGGNTNDTGDIIMRQAKANGFWLSDEELKSSELSHD